MSNERMDHDRWFKELMTTFFEEFILAFFPDVWEHLDFQHVSFLNQEVYTDILKGRKGTVDILAETKLKGEDALVVVHVEPQSTFQDDFSERMFFYFSRLHEKFDCPIIPIAVFSYDEKKDEQSEFSVHFPFKEILTFRYFSIQLKQQNWRNYINQPNPVALALLGKMGYDEKEKVRIKLEFLRMLLKLQLDPAKQQLVTGIFEKYHILSLKEEQELENEMNQIPKDEVNQIMELMTSWEQKGIEKGIERGIEKGFEKGIENGIEKGKLEVAKKLLTMGLEIEKIIEATGLSKEEIEKIIGS